uniref:ferroxidase n=1 Tax=Gadus morhua TaxID=8049 RepID=A0A8C5CSN6_GADMO
EKDFKQPKTHPLWLGLLGPTLRAQEGETIVVTFRNMADREYSLHPHGIAYGKQSEGAPYFDNTSLKEKEDDVVRPGAEHTYYWEVTSNVAPQKADPACLTYTYVSHLNVVKDYNSGLIGTLLLCKPGSLNEFGEQVHFPQEYVFLFGVFDEKESWFTPAGYSSSNHVMHTINGYAAGSLPDVNICAHSTVSLHLVGMSSEQEVFSVHMNGQVLQHRGHKMSTVGLVSGSATTGSMRAVHPGRWLLSSQTNKHMEAGMHGFVDVRTCKGFEANRRRLTIEQQRHSKEWTYYIAAEEIMWNYAPKMPTYIDEDFKVNYLDQGNHRIGGTYKKAVYTQYTDETFTVRSEEKQRKAEVGILGPVIRAQIRDVIKVVFKNMASKPYSIYPHGLTIEKSQEGATYPEGGNQTHAVQPGQTHHYEWKVVDEDEPLDTDARCLTYLYHSAVDTPRDIASGLIGPLLICKSQSLNVRNVQLKADKEQHAMFMVFDENKSWYLDDNIQSTCGGETVNKAEPGFYKSNVMHTINGYVFESGQLLGFCNGEIATWHVSSVGAQDYIQSVTFYGHTFNLNDRTEDILGLYPMTGETIFMNMDNIGVWLLATLNSHGSTKGMRVRFQDVECYRDYEYEYTDYNEPNKEFAVWKPATLAEIDKEDELKKKQEMEEKKEAVVDSYTDYYAGLLGLRSLKKQIRDSDIQPVSNTEDLINIPVVIGVPRPDWSDYELYVPSDNQDNLIDLRDDSKQDEYEYVSYKDPYGSKDDMMSFTLDEVTKYYLKTVGKNVRTYFISAEEVEWDYAEKTLQTRRETKFTKVVFREYIDSTFTTPILRGEMEEHLGILGPLIKAEVGQSIMVVFRNRASRPYSMHPNGVTYTKLTEGLSYEDESKYWYKFDNEVQPNTTFTYLWEVREMAGPMPGESSCRTWAYYSGVNPERDIHSGLIGPLLVCRKDTLNTKLVDVREFVLLFMTFDESQSWYYEKNSEMRRRRKGRVAINGIIFSLKGLRLYTKQLACWHLINMGSPKDVHTVHFHGQTFTQMNTNSYRQAVYPLLPGGFATLEMWPSKPGLWQLDTEVGAIQQKGMQTLFLVLDNECSNPLGLESGSVKDSQITSNHVRGYWEPHLARLNKQGKYNAWSTDEDNSWIQVDFLRPVVISQVATQGAKQMFHSQYVVNYTISYSTDRRSWIFFKGDSPSFRKNFPGNNDANGVEKQILFPPLIGRYVRFHPNHWYNRATVRMEMYGCELDGCSVPLGMEDGLIKDHQITASSRATSWFGGPWNPSLARLNLQGTVNAWQALNADMNQWLQIELTEVKKITGIITQGAKSMGKEMYIVSFTLEYSEDGVRWTSRTLFIGNTDNNGPVRNYIYPPIFSRFIRVIPTSWKSSITMRMELLGCDFE